MTTPGQYPGSTPKQPVAANEVALGGSQVRNFSPVEDNMADEDKRVLTSPESPRLECHPYHSNFFSCSRCG